VVICPELGADLHMAQLMPLPLTVSCFSKIQIGFTSRVQAHLGSPGQRVVKRVYVLWHEELGVGLLLPGGAGSTPGRLWASCSHLYTPVTTQSA